MTTLKVGSTGRFGSRYGVGIRRKLLKVEPLQFKRHDCPNCGSESVKRQSRGIFNCSKCLHSFVGGSYVPRTLAGTIISKMVTQKTFAPEMVDTLAKGLERDEPAKAPVISETQESKFPRAKKEKPKKAEEEVSQEALEESESGEES
ncbi:MAG TPA: 50S ribosomal protein L37ae [archaeon]|nr:50S ribosomal protein L37ae [archaeon]